MKLRTPNENGQVLVLVALLMVVVLGLAALALDIGRAYGVKARLNAAVDAASYEATKAMGQGSDEALMKIKAAQVAEAYFSANYPATGYLGAIPGTPSITPEHDATTGLWKVSVAATANMPTFLTGLPGLGWSSFDIGASSQSQRRSLDMVLVLDTSRSLTNAGVYGAVLANSQTYVNMFNEADDRLGLVAFSTGAAPVIPICRDTPTPSPQNPVAESISCRRGFSGATINSAIAGLPVNTDTNSEEGMKKALDQLNSLSPSSRSSLRVIVFFSDGAPNTINGSFLRATGGTVAGNLYSKTSTDSATFQYPMFDQTRYDDNTGRGTRLAVPLQTSGTDLSGIVPLASYNNIRTFSGGRSDSDLHCDINRAARNMAENVANIARSQGITVFTLGLGTFLNSLEIPDCGYTSVENGANILRRMANTADSDTYNSNQPTGIYCFAQTPAQLQPCFDQIASAILRITR
jgi:Flp pilus assembly protein TadG